MTSLIQLNFIFYSEEPVTLAYVFCFALFYCLDCNVNCIRDFGIILYKVFLIFFSSGFSHNKHREVVDELSFPKSVLHAGADLGGGCRGCAPPLPPPEMTCGFLIQLVFCKKKLCGLLVLK